jgi:hypothetical protein
MNEPLEATWPWRSGKSIGRTIYCCPPGSSYRNGEILIGMMDTPELAQAVVDAHNASIREAKASAE